MVRKLLLILLFCIASDTSFAMEGVYSSRNKDLIGQATYGEVVDYNGENKGAISFSITNSTKGPIDLSHLKYYALSKEDALYALDLIGKPMINFEENSILNPGSQAVIDCNVNAIGGNPVALFMEFKDGDRVYFVEEGKPDLFSAWYLRLLKSVFNLFRSIGSVGPSLWGIMLIILIGLSRSAKKSKNIF